MGKESKLAASAIARNQAIFLACLLCLMLVVSCTTPWSKKARLVREVELAASHGLNEADASPVGITNEFTDGERMCVSAKVRLRENQLPAGTGLPVLRVGFNFFWHLPNAANAFPMGAMAVDLGDGWKAGGLCLEPGDVPGPKGRYVVRVQMVDIELGKIVFSVK